MPESQALKIETNGAVPMRDGTIRYADLYRPDGPHSKWVGSGRVTLRYVSPIPPLEPSMRLSPRTAHDIGEFMVTSLSSGCN
jgi:hypothetical protein